MALVMTGWLLALMFIVLVVVPVRVESAMAFCEKVVQPLGYGCAEFTVQTDDGFVLALHRLSRLSVSGDDNSTQSPVTPNSRADHTSQRSASESRTRSNDRKLNFRERQALAVSQLMVPTSYAPVQAPSPHTISPTQKQLINLNLANGSVQEQILPPAPSGNPAMAPGPFISPNISSNKTSEQPSSAPAPHPSPAQNGTTHSTPTAPGSAPNYTANSETGKGAPVLLMHQEFLNGDSWFFKTDNSVHACRLLPFMLLGDGFDVWIGHQRATYWGHGHIHLKPTDREYWDWTWDQHADYDLPAQLRFISAETNQPVHFIGASQSATVGAAGSTNHETAQMLRSLTLIGPTAYRGNSNSLLLDAWAYYFGAALDAEYYSTGFQNGAFNFTSEFPGAGDISGTGLSGLAIGLISGPNCCLGSTVFQIKDGWDGTTSFKNLLHWQQGIRTNRFARYDYGMIANNTAAYGQPMSPTYNPAQIPRRLPLLIIAGGRDWTAPPSGILTFMRLLQEPAKLIINLTGYAHYDLSFSVTRENDVYLPILQFLEGDEFD